MSMNRRSFFGKMAAALVATPAVVEAAPVAPAPVSGPGLPTATFRGLNQDATLQGVKRKMFNARVAAARRVRRPKNESSSA